MEFSGENVRKGPVCVLVCLKTMEICSVNSKCLSMMSPGSEEAVTHPSITAGLLENPVKRQQKNKLFYNT